MTFFKYHKNEDAFLYLRLNCHLSVGDVFNITVTNEDRSVWDVEEIIKTVKVMEISKTTGINYPRGGNVGGVREYLYIDVVVEDITQPDKPESETESS